MENREQRMARRKPMQVVQVNLRLREALRRKLEAAARQRGVSLNFEMTDRLAKSFEQDEAKSVAETIAQEIRERVTHVLAATFVGGGKLTAALTVQSAPEGSPEIGGAAAAINPPAEPTKPKEAGRESATSRGRVGKFGEGQ
jgi:hypothetical protein